MQNHFWMEINCFWKVSKNMGSLGLISMEGCRVFPAKLHVSKSIVLILWRKLMFHFKINWQGGSEPTILHILTQRPLVFVIICISYVPPIKLNLFVGHVLVVFWLWFWNLLCCFSFHSALCRLVCTLYCFWRVFLWLNKCLSIY